MKKKILSVIGMILCLSMMLSFVGCNSGTGSLQTGTHTDQFTQGIQSESDTIVLPTGTVSEIITEIQTQTVTDTQTTPATLPTIQIQTEEITVPPIQIQTETESMTLPPIEPETETETPTETQPQTETESETETQTQTQTETVTETETETETEKQTQKETEEQGVSFRLKFASYNIFHAEKAGYDVSKIAKNITDNAIDVVGLQEVDQKTSRSGRLDTMKKLSEATGYKYYVFFKAISFQGGEYGLGILSKYPIESSGSIKLTSGDEQRVLGRATIVKKNTKINFFVTHLSYDGEDGTNSNTRKTQFSQIASELAKYDNFVLSGDFNTRNLGEYSVIRKSALVNTKENPQITYPDGRSPLDNLVYSTNVWTFGDPKIIKNSYSDHYMICSQGVYKSAK